MSRRTDGVPEEAVVSPQVRSARYFFLDVTLGRRQGVRPAYGGWEQCRPDYRVEREGFPWFTLEWVAAGRGTVVLNGRSHALSPGALFRYDRRTRFEIVGDPAAPLEKYFLCLTGGSASARLDQVGIAQGGLLYLTSLEEVRRTWDELIEAAKRGGPMGERLGLALAEVLLLRLEARCSGAGEGGEREREFRSAKERVDEAAPTLMRLGDLTRVTGLGVTRISRLFRRYEGVSPAQYLLRRKMHLAAESLLSGRLRVKEVAAQLGFSDPFHFSRCFKRVYGMSPRQFVKGPG